MPTNKFLSIPLNAKGILSIENEIDDPENIHDYQIPDEEWKQILDSNLLEQIDQVTNLQLADQTKEVIEPEHVSQIFKILEENDLASGVFAAALFELRYTGTFVVCGFA